MTDREIYSKHFKIKIPRDYRILHINGNEQNNRISNMLLLPKAEYDRLMRAYRNLCRIKPTDTLDFRKNFQLALKDDTSMDNFVGYLEEFWDSCGGIFFWVVTKHYEQLRKQGVKVSESLNDYSYNMLRNEAD